MKVPIETLPVELRIKIYELGDVGSIMGEFEYVRPWARTILMSGILNDKDAIEIAAIQKGKPRKFMCEVIAYSGNIPMMKWARSDRSSPKDDAVMDRSMTMKRIRLTPFPWSEYTCANAAKFGHLTLLKWLHEQGCPWDILTFGSAAAFGNIKILEWLYQKKCPWHWGTFCHAARAGTLDVLKLKWLHERKCPWSEHTFAAAVETGNLGLVEWLIEQNCPRHDCHVLGTAAGTGNLTMVKWLVDRGFPMNKDACSSAAYWGKLEILKWLHEQKCPWDGKTCKYARKYGYDNVYSWAILNGCPDDNSSDSDDLWLDDEEESSEDEVMANK
jgi:hypothetical protein